MGAGTAYIVLNVLRVCSVVALLLVCSTSVMIIAVHAQHFKLFFFSIMSQVFQAVSCLFLIASEIPAKSTSRFLERKVAVLAQGSSLAWTGWPMIVLATGVFSELRLPILETEKVGHVLRALILTAGSITGLIGVAYAILPLIFWRLPPGECRRARKNGAVGAPVMPLPMHTGEKEDPLHPGTPYYPPMQISRPIIGSESGGSSTSSHSAVTFPSFQAYTAEKALAQKNGPAY